MLLPLSYHYFSPLFSSFKYCMRFFLSSFLCIWHHSLSNSFSKIFICHLSSSCQFFFHVSLWLCFFLFVRRFIFSDTNIDFLDSIADVCNVWCISYWNCYNLWSGASLGCRFCMVSSWWKVGSLRMGWCSPCARYDNDLNVPVVLLFTIFWLSYCMTNSLTTYFNESKVWHNGMHWEPLNTVTSVELCVIVFDTFWTWHLSDMLSTCVWLSLLCQITFLSLDTSSTQIEHK